MPESIFKWKIKARAHPLYQRKVMKQFKSFRYFTEKSKSLQLWRFICRTAYKTQPPQRHELLDWARHEFKQHSRETDPDKIRYLVSEGLKSAREMDRLLDHI